MAASTVTRVAEKSKEVQELLSEHEALTYEAKKNKVRCRLSGHEMPCSAKAIRSYVNGKKYNKLRHEAQYDHSDVSQHIVPNTKRGLEHLLFCKLTLRHINNCPADIDVHVRGRKFKRALARWKNCQKTGETFKPLASLKQKGPATSWDRPQKKKGGNSDSEQEEEDDQSDLSDLYPDADFAMSEDEEGSEVEDDRGDNEDIRRDNEDGRPTMDVESDSDSEIEDLDLMESNMDGDSELGSRENRTVTNSDDIHFTKISDLKGSDKAKSAARKRSSKALKETKVLSGPGGKRKKKRQT